MNDDILKGNAKKLRGQMREWWGKLTDDDLEQAAGKKDKLIGKLQERYGYSREQAQQEVERRMGDQDKWA
jgi:uncharacterized protein YjbJ (UPF0337 family)